MAKPLVSIITVCLNAKDTIEATINSVRQQTYENIEYIIIDGASTDGTKEIIEQNRDAVTKFVSEPDKGIYFAMNRGIDEASGDYLWFINAGDRIPHSNTLEKILSSSYLPQDIYYGQTKIIDNKGRTVGMRRLRPPHHLDKNSFKWGMTVCHQAAIVRRAIARYYDTRYKVAADYDWLLSCIERGDSSLMRFSSRTYIKFLEGGYATQNMKLANKERYKIMVKHYGYTKATFYNVLMGFRYLWAKIYGRV